MKKASKISAYAFTIVLLGALAGGTFASLTYATTPPSASGSNTPRPSASGSNTTAPSQSGSNTSQGGGAGSQTITFPNPTPYESIMDLLRAVLDAIVRILMPVIAIMLIVSGFLFITAGGDVKKLETAKKTFIGTIIGAAIVLGAWALATAIAGTVQGL